MTTAPTKPVRPTFSIHPIAIPGLKGLIGIAACPGLKDETTRFDLYGERLINDLVAIHNWGTAALITLLDEFELSTLGVKDLPNKAKQLNIKWRHLPIGSNSLPDQLFEDKWLEVGPLLRQLLQEGKRVVIHCKEGIGRSGLIAARLLIEFGIHPENAINLVRQARPGSLALPSHEDYCHTLEVGKPLTDLVVPPPKKTVANLQRNIG
jgi:protein-tyrosine phosphatase